MIGTQGGGTHRGEHREPSPVFARLVISKELIMILEGILVYKLISHNTVSTWNIVIHICILGEGLATANRLTCGIWSE